MTDKMPISRLSAKKDAANFEFTAPLYSGIADWRSLSIGNAQACKGRRQER